MKIASSSPERLLAVRGGSVETRADQGHCPPLGRCRRRCPACRRARRVRKGPRRECDDRRSPALGPLCRLPAGQRARAAPQCGRELRRAAPSRVYGHRELVEGADGGRCAGRCLSRRVDHRRAEDPGDGDHLRLERAPRGIYCGAIGYLGFDGSADFNIAIRTVTFAGGKASLGAGSGITMLSDPAAEEAEARLKAARMLAAFGRPA